MGQNVYLSEGTLIAEDGEIVVVVGGSGAVDSVNSQTGVVVLDAGDIGADSTTLVGTGTDVQAVLEELDNGIADHLADTTAAHAATAVSFAPAGTIAASTVQAAIEEVATDAGLAYQPVDADLTLLAALSGSTALTGANFATDDLAAVYDTSATAFKKATLQELQRGIVATDWTSLGNLGATETITGTTLGTSRSYGTLDQACTITVTTSANMQAMLQLTQDATGGRAITWSGVDAWATTDGAAPSLSFRAAASVDNFYFEDINGVCTGYWLTESPVITQMVQVTDPNGSALTTGDGKNTYVVPNILGGYNLVSVRMVVTTQSSSGIPTFQIANVTQAADMLTTKITVDANESTSATAATAVVIDAANDDVAALDVLRFDADVAGTGTKGVHIELGFRKP